MSKKISYTNRDFAGIREELVNLTKDSFISINMADSFVNLEEVLVSAVRVKATSPVTHSNVTKEDLEKRFKFLKVYRIDYKKHKAFYVGLYLVYFLVLLFPSVIIKH